MSRQVWNGDQVRLQRFEFKLDIGSFPPLINFSTLEMYLTDHKYLMCITGSINAYLVKVKINCDDINKILF